MRIFIFIFLTYFGCTNPKMITRIDQSSVEQNILSNKIKELMGVAEVTGLSVTILNKNEVIYQNAFGYANNKTEDSLSSDMIFYGASFSKAVFGFLVAQLVEEGLLDLDRPLQEYLDKPIPDFEFGNEWRSYANLREDKRYERITARMCMSHTTGFPNWRWMTRDFDFDPEGKIRFLFDPGTRYSYSGEGINLLQFVIEEMTGIGLDEMARKRIFDPLGMHMTSYVWREEFEGRFCHGHDQYERVIPKDKEDEANAAGSLETTPEDYAKFIAKILRLSNENSRTTELLFHPNVRIRSRTQFGYQSWEDTTENNDINLSYGLGWGLLYTPYGLGAFKEGHGEGFQHYSIIFPEQETGILMMSNSDNGESIFKELLEISIGDIYTPWEWERYTPYDLKK